MAECIAPLTSADSAIDTGCGSDSLIDRVIERGLSHTLSPTASDRLVVAVQALSLAKTYDDIRHVVSRMARAITGADGATYVLREGDLCAYVDEDAIGPLWKGGRFPMAACISGWAMLNRQVAVIPDIYADARIPHDAYRPTFVKSLVMVPVRAADPIGAIGNYWAQRHEASDEEVRLLQSLADATSVAVQNVRLLSELETSLAMLRRRNQEMERFVQMISHDLRTPTTNIGNHAGLLRARLARGDTEGAARGIDAIETNARHMHTRLRDLSVFLRTGQEVSPTDAFTLTDLARDVMALFGEAIQSDDVSVIIDTDTPLLTADRARVFDVLQNLIDNAIKYRDPDRPLQLHIGAAIVDDAVRCFVRDNGKGIDPPYLEQVFGLFNRLEAGGEGTGVGLSIARRIVEAHGGRIWAESGGRNHGCTFYFTLPRIIHRPQES